MLDKLFKSMPLVAMTKALDTASVRQKVISNNIANVDTPHFKRSEVNFEDAFKAAIERTPSRLAGFRTDGRHIPINPPTSIDSVKPTIWRQNDTFSRADDNNVDIDVEMAELAKNQLLFNAVVEAMDRKTAGIKKAISGR